MIRKRVNTDLFLRLSIVMKDGSPANFTGAQDLKAVVWHSLYTNIRQEQSIEVEDNVISLQYSSEENQKTGRYGVSVFWSKADSESETGRRDYAVDFTEAFTIVPYSEQEDDGTIEYTGKVNQNPDGIGAGGEVDLLDYYKKKEVDDKLKKKVDAVAGKGLSECNFTKDEKDKLSSLSNYDDLELRKLVGEKADKTSVYTRQEVDTKLLATTSLITTDEQKVGILRYRGKDYTIYELTTEFTSLSRSAGESTDVILSDQPFGNNLYLRVECLSVSFDENFPVSSYEVKKVYIDGLGNTVATIVCKEAVTGEPKALLTIRYVKGLLSFETFELSIPVSELGIASTNEVTVEIPALKYNKKMAFSYSMDDGKSGNYEYFFKHVINNQLAYTDGCGNNILFNFGNAWATFNYLGVDLHNSASQINGMLWSNLIKMLDFGGGVYNHGGGVYDNPNSEKTDELAQESLDQNGNAILNKTGRYPFYLVVPGGAESYMQPWYNILGKNEDSIYAYTKKSFPHLIDPATLSLGQFPHSRTNWDDFLLANDLTTIKGKFDTAYATYDKVLYFCFSHTPGRPDMESDQQMAANTVYPFLDYIYNTYGSKGTDTVWITSGDEIYEYIFSLQNSLIQTSIKDDKLIIKVKMGVLPGFMRKDLSLLIKSSNPETSKTIAISPNVVFMSSGKLDDNHILVNVSLSLERIRLVEKYVSLYEANANNNTLYEANYMVGRIKESLRQSYIDRIQAATSSPILNGITLDGGKDTTNKREISVEFNVVAPITHYRIGESTDLSAVEYIAGSSKTVSYTLSENYGDKTIYVQVKNDMGESGIKSSQISYQEKVVTYHTVTASVNDSTYGSVLPITQQVEEGADVTITATANEGYVIDSWDGADEFTGVGESSGTATAKNVIVDKEITCNFKEAITATNTLISFGYDHTSSIPSNSSMYDSENKITKIRVTIDTAETTYDVYDRAGNKSCTIVMNGLIFGNESFQGNETGDESGIYPDIVLKNINYKKAATEKAYIKINNLASGKYKFKVFINTKKTVDLSKANYELIADTTQKFTLKTTYVDNFYSAEELIAYVSSQVILNISTTDTKNNTLLLNAIVIEKIG